MKIKISIVGLIIFLHANLLFGGDIAHFVNLGFSNNDGYFMFGQYGVNEANTFPYADLFVVDVPTNKFVANGVKHSIFEIAAEPGYPGEGALFTLLGNNQSLKKKYDVNHLKTGRLLYLLVDGEKPKKELDFRDFVTGNRFQVKLIQNVYGNGADIKSSFYIDLTVLPKGRSAKTFWVGLPDYKRKGVKGYRIRQILLSPIGKAMVFLIEKEETDKTGANVRYMIESLRLD